MPFLSTTERVSFAVGAVLMVALVPLVGAVVGTCVLWDGLDRLFLGRPLDGVVMSLARFVNKVRGLKLAAPASRPRAPGSGGGVCLPALFFF